MDIVNAFPQFTFIERGDFVWSPNKNTVYFNQELLEEPTGRMALLHEIGHALLGHQDFDFDVELLSMEMDAWEKARELSKQFSLEIDEDHVDDCIDSYRSWLHNRSQCPKCHTTSSQIDNEHYSCFMCHTKWKVSASQAKRTHRKIVNAL